MLSRRPVPPTSLPAPYGPPPPGSRTVVTDDGVRLHVEVDGSGGSGEGTAPVTVVPDGPVMLAGHSMGGMSIMALARQRPELFGARVVGVFLEHDESASLAALRRVPVTVVAATHDRLTPAAHGRRIAELIGANAELVVVPGAGHSVNLTRPEIVDRAFLRLLDRVGSSAQQAG